MYLLLLMAIISCTIQVGSFSTPKSTELAIATSHQLEVPQAENGLVTQTVIHPVIQPVTQSVSSNVVLISGEGGEEVMMLEGQQVVLQQQATSDGELVEVQHEVIQQDINYIQLQGEEVKLIV